MADASRRKRKWDVTAPGDNEDKDDASQDPVSAAALAAKKLNTMLATTGVANILAFEKEVEINHCRPDTRYHLCKGTTHIEIEEKTGASIKVKGRYKPPGDTSLERPLHLWVGAPTKEALDAAVNRINEIIRNDQARATQTNQTVSFIAKVYVGMEGTDPIYDPLIRVTGPNNSYIDHIQNVSQAQVLLRGQGSGWKDSNDIKEAMEPLHLYINAKNKAGLDKAKALCENLCSTIRQEYYSWLQQKQQYEQQYAAFGYTQGYGYSGYGMQGYGAYPQSGYGAYPAQTTQGGGYYSYPEGAVPQQNAPVPAQAPPPPPAPTTPNNGPKPAQTPTSPQQPQQRRFQEKKGGNEDNVPGPKLPSKDDQYSYYSDPSAQPGGAKTNDQGTKKTTAPVSRTVAADKSKSDPPKLVDYEEPAEQKPNRSAPFWAAPGALDDAETNPLKQREKAEAEVESLKDDVYKELGIR